MKNNKIKYLPLLLLLTFACNRQKSNHEHTIKLAEVGDKILYAQDMNKIIPDELASPDSALHAQNYIDSWIKKQLLLEKASLNLSNEQKDVSQQLEEYRTALLIYKYESQFVVEKSDTVVADSAVKNYYEHYKDNFTVNNILLRGLYIKIPNDIPGINKIKAWIRSKRTSDSTQLLNFCHKYADKYDNFDGKWVYFNTLQMQWPVKIVKPEQTIRYTNLLSQKDSLFSYFFRINGYLLKGDYSPLEFERNKIKNIILNKRKIGIINKLENDIYNDALKHNAFKIFDNKNENN